MKLRTPWLALFGAIPLLFSNTLTVCAADPQTKPPSGTNASNSETSLSAEAAKQAETNAVAAANQATAQAIAAGIAKTNAQAAAKQAASRAKAAGKSPNDAFELAKEARKAAEEARESANFTKGSITEGMTALTEAEKLLRDFGRVDIGRPLLISLGREFEFNLTNDANFYFHQFKTNTQGAHASFAQSQLAVGLSLSAQKSQLQMQAGQEKIKQFQQEVNDYETKRKAIIAAAESKRQADFLAAETNTTDVAKAMARAQAEKTYADTIPGTNSRPQFPTGFLYPTNEFGTNVTNAIKTAFTNDKFSGFMSLLSNLNVAVSTPNRPAIINAAGDKWTADIFKALGSQEREDEFAADRAFFGFTTVSVEPGLKTQRDYAAHVSAIATIDYVEARPEVVLRLMSDKAQTWLTGQELAIIAEDYGYTSSAVLNEMLKRLGLELSSTVGDWFEERKKEKAFWAAVKTQPIENTFAALKSQVAAPKSIKILGKTVSLELRGTNETGVTPDFTMRNVTNIVSEAKDIYLTNHPANIANVSGQIPVAVTVVGPLNESESFDLAESTRQQREFALQMAATYEASGQQAKGNFFGSYAKRLENDTRLRTAWNAVNSFSGSEGSFGFEIGPRPLSADGMKSKRGRELQRHSFPALLLLQVGRGGSDVRIKVVGEGDSRKIRVMEPAIRLIQHRRWQQTSTGFWRGMHPLHHEPLIDTGKLPFASTAQYLIRGLDPLGWAHSKDSIPNVQKTVMGLHNLIENGTRTKSPSDQAKIWASRARELSDQLAGGISHVNLPIDSVVDIGNAKGKKGRTALEGVEIVGETTFKADANGTVNAEILLKFAGPLPQGAEGLLGANKPLIAIASGAFLAFTNIITNVTNDTLLHVGGLINGKSVYATNQITLKAQPKPNEFAIQEIILPREISYSVDDPNPVSFAIAFNISHTNATTNFGIFPAGLGQTSDPKTNGSGKILTFNLRLTKAPSGGALAVVITNGIQVYFSRPITVVSQNRPTAEHSSVTLAAVQGQTNLTYTLTANGQPTDKLIGAATNLFRSEFLTNRPPVVPSTK